MTELEFALEEAKKTGMIALRFEAVKEEETKFSMDFHGVREDHRWALRISSP